LLAGEDAEILPSPSKKQVRERGGGLRLTTQKQRWSGGGENGWRWVKGWAPATGWRRKGSGWFENSKGTRV